MNKLLVKLQMAAMAGGVLCASSTLAQDNSASNPQNVQMTQPVDVEIVRDDMCILRWATSAPAGPASDQFAIARCGERPDSMDQEWKSHIHVNKGHSETRWRVRIQNLKPQTTYYCKVTSRDGNGNNTGPESDLYQFTTMEEGGRYVKYGQPGGPPQR
ncbi:MAG: fibronectin type III domain-containing protein [Acetobacteraceae bacterium]|nr:fibronectin type III domain-containing protein [Acetobacteraceae bacterium]